MYGLVLDTRAAAASRLAGMMAETEVVGVRTNIDFLGRIITHASFLDADLSTRFIEAHEDDLLTSPPPPVEAIGLAVLADFQRRREALPATAACSPWDDADGFRLNMDWAESLRFAVSGAEIEVGLRRSQSGQFLSFEGDDYALEQSSGPYGKIDRYEIDGRQFSGRAHWVGGEITVGFNGQRWTFTPIDPAAEAGAEAGAGSLASPMPGKIVRVEVAAGAKVKKGDPLVALEAMKMEHVITAPADGVVESLNCALGDQVEEGVALVVINAA